jgi:hypothetical protein
MIRKGRGRGAGAKWFWDCDVLEQAVAADCLLSRYHRTDVVAYGLWISGFAVAPDVVKANWLNCIERDETAVRREAARSRRDFYGLGKSQWKKVLRDSESLSLRQFIVELVVGEKHKKKASEESFYWHRLGQAIADWYPLPESDPVTPGGSIDVLAGQFVGAFSAWMLGDEEHDSEEIRCLFAECIEAIETQSNLGSGGGNLYELTEGFWEKTEFESIFETESSKSFVASLTEAELDMASTAMVHIREVAGHFLDFRDGPVGKIESIQKQLAVMESIGPFWTKVLISLHRNRPSWPIWKTVETLHAFVISVKLEDLLTTNKSGPLVSIRFHEKWKKCKEEMSELWKPVIPQVTTP